MWCLGSGFSGRLGSAELTVGFDDFKCLFQSKQFHYSINFFLITSNWPEANCKWSQVAENLKS